MVMLYVFLFLLLFSVVLTLGGIKQEADKKMQYQVDDFTSTRSIVVYKCANGKYVIKSKGGNSGKTS